MFDFGVEGNNPRGARRICFSMVMRENMNARAKCPECGGSQLYSTPTSSYGSHGPVLLPGLHSWMRYPNFEVVVCADCGLTRFFAEESARQKLSSSKKWKRVTG